jgi:hypothetical protein
MGHALKLPVEPSIHFNAEPSNMRNPFRSPALALAVYAGICAATFFASAYAQTPAVSATPVAPAGPAPVAGNASTVMTCADGANFQCSGADAIRTDNGVVLTGSGVQVHGKSTSDLKANNANVNTATGMALASGGLAELRVAKDANLLSANPVAILKNLGISWDGRTERPPIIETFQPTSGRSVLSANGAVTSAALPDPGNLSFYDFAVKGMSATQANYANNRYFPRANNPSRCPAAVPPASCPATETAGVQVAAGDWRIGGTVPDEASALRLHEDGDVHAGNATPGPNGTVNLLSDASGVGVPFPGSKGFRSIRNLGYRYGNLAKWLTQDGVDIVEWSDGTEHNQNRRGLIAYGDVTPPAAVPAAGAAMYSGFAYGWYVPNANDEPASFHADAAIMIDYATRQVHVVVANAVSEDAAPVPLPAVSINSIALLGANGTNVANYLAAPIAAGTLSGGLGGRLFGPGGAAGAEEVGTTFSVTNATTGAVLLGGILARRR